MSLNDLTIDATSLDLNFKGATILGRCSGIAGIVQTCRHTPSHPSSSQPVTLAVKRYDLERRREKSDNENFAISDFNELSKLVQV
jgi:hypothetical protein